MELTNKLMGNIADLDAFTELFEAVSPGLQADPKSLLDITRQLGRSYYYAFQKCVGFTSELTMPPQFNFPSGICNK